MDRHLAFLKNIKAGIYVLSKAELPKKDINLLEFLSQFTIDAHLGDLKHLVYDLEEDNAEKMKKIHEKLLMDIEVLKSTMNRITVYEGKGFSKVEEVQENVDKMVCRAEAIEEINNLSNSKSDLDKEFDELLRQDSNN